MAEMKKSSVVLTCLLLLLLCGVLAYIDGNASGYIIRITRLCAINIVLALSMNLVQGFTGIFSLGHAGFMALGAYSVALLTIYDMCKAIDKRMEITGVHLAKKTGGKSGVFINDPALEEASGEDDAHA